MNTIRKKVFQSTINKVAIFTILVLLASCGVTKEKKVSEQGYSAYLFAYFTGNAKSEEAIRFALSKDGFNYYALNNNEAVIDSKDISLTGGVRDPHILRGADGKTFYMVVTDMVSANGWNSNRGMVLMKSTDLINWTSSAINIPTTYPDKFGDVLRVWAPQTIYDRKAKKYMVYFSMFQPGGIDIIYYAYVNENFTALEGTPKQLYYSPTNGATIDGDIIEKDGKYHLFMKTEDTADKGIMVAVSDNLTSGYELQPGYVDQTNEAVEGSSVFKLIDSDSYILMYDMYAKGSYQFTSSTDLKNFKVIDQQISMNFHPRHGTVIPITKEESERLIAKFGWFPNSEILGATAAAINKNNIAIDVKNNKILLPVKNGTDLKNFDPEFKVNEGTTVTPQGPQNFSNQTVKYEFDMGNLGKMSFDVQAVVRKNPALAGFYADPEVLYSEKTGRFYIYPTTDGFPGWGGYKFSVFSSADLVNWTDEGVILDLKSDQVSWAKGNAWAPAIIEKKINGGYKYFYYFSGDAGSKKEIGVAVADNPTGPFTDLGKPMISEFPAGARGQLIDGDVFQDPVSGKSYFYYGNGFMAVSELNDDMTSIKPNTSKIITPQGGSNETFRYREGTYVFYRNGLYYFLWSVDDTGSPNYHVAYGTSKSPTGPIEVAAQPIVIQQDKANKIYGPAHNSVLQIPGKDEWYIVYHRINANYIHSDPGVHREVCIDRLTFDGKGNIIKVQPSVSGIEAVNLNKK